MAAYIYHLYTFFAIVLLSLACSSAAFRGKKFDCKAFCQRSAFRGSVGSCHCGFALFSSKRSESPEPDDQMLQEPVTRKSFDAVMQVLFPDAPQSSDQSEYIDDNGKFDWRRMVDLSGFRQRMQTWKTQNEIQNSQK
ncbi:Uncharacterised protein g4355 [Pycnogonum litorale]